MKDPVVPSWTRTHAVLPTVVTVASWSLLTGAGARAQGDDLCPVSEQVSADDCRHTSSGDRARVIDTLIPANWNMQDPDCAAAYDALKSISAGSRFRRYSATPTGWWEHRSGYHYIWINHFAFDIPAYEETLVHDLTHELGHVLFGASQQLAEELVATCMDA